MKTRTTLIILALVGLLAAVVIPLAFCADKKGIANEIANWDWNTYPLICSPPQLQCGPSLSKKQCADQGIAEQYLERGLKRPLYTQSKTATPLVMVHAKVPKHIDDEGPCGGDERASILGHLGRTYRTPEFGPVVERFDIVVCFGLIRQAQEWRDTQVGVKTYEAIKTVGRLGNVGHIAHELLHPYMGDRVDHAHPVYGVGLMLAKPRTMKLGPVVRGVFGRIDKRCNRRKR